jgi:hypothetical protein
LQAKLLLCERITYVLHYVAPAGAWERGKGGMRCAFPLRAARKVKGGTIEMKKSIVMAIAMSLILVGSVQAQKKADQGVNLFDLGAKGIVTVK